MIILLLALLMVEKLGHEEYDVREDAEVELKLLNKELDLQGVVGLAKDRHPSPEVRRRAERVYNAYRDVSPTACDYFPRVEFMKPAQYDEAYERVCLEHDVYSYHDPYAQASSEHRWLYEEDSKRRRAGRAYAMLLMDRGLLRNEITAKLDEAVALEKRCGLVPAEEP